MGRFSTVRWPRTRPFRRSSVPALCFRRFLVLKRSFAPEWSGAGGLWGGRDPDRPRRRRVLQGHPREVVPRARIFSRDGNIPQERGHPGRGKRSLAISSKTRRGKKLLLQLVARSDVLIDPFRPGVMERLGLGPDVCKRASEGRLIYARLSGFRRSGQWSKMAGHGARLVIFERAIVS